MMFRYRPTQKHTDDAAEYFGSSPKKPQGRGKAQKTIALIAAMYDIAKAMQPITGRGVGYKLFVAKLIPSMSTKDMKVVYRLLKLAREEGTIPWEWIVDETREIERVPSWDDPEHYLKASARDYRRDFWKQQPVRLLVISEKGTVRGLLKPILDQYGVGFLPVHGFNSATNVHELCEDYDGRDLIILYVGDYDPSGLCMSEVDLPKRFANPVYGGDHIEIKRIALTRDDVRDPALISFPASDKKGDTRYKWFDKNYGDRCWELDAMNPNDLRARVEEAIKEHIEPIAWARCEVTFKAEMENMQKFFASYKKPRTKRYRPISGGGGIHRAARKKEEA